mmetsp:Transcript_10357/g.42909  ORF Transcript_10357/g.42909 Transcript_10357/m.42909 type:complete len:250 (+) Transcript_10357:1007-1756(+)
MMRVEVEAHDARIRGERILGVAGVLQRIAADQPAHLLHEIEGSVPDREQVVVRRIPRDRGDVPSLRAFVVELPQRQQRALALSKAVALVLPVLEILSDVVVGVLVDHALHDLNRARHRHARHHLRLFLLGRGLGLLLLLRRRLARLLRLLRLVRRRSMKPRTSSTSPPARPRRRTRTTLDRTSSARRRIRTRRALTLPESARGRARRTPRRLGRTPRRDGRRRRRRRSNPRATSRRFGRPRRRGTASDR